MDNKVFFTDIKVLWSQCDPNRHLNVGQFQVYFHEGRMISLAEVGMSFQEMQVLGIGPMIIRSETDYKQEVLYPETIRVETFYSDFTGARCKVHQRMIRLSDQKIASQSISECLMFDFQKKRPWKIKPEFIEKLTGISMKLAS